MNELRPVGAASRFAPVARNPGTPLTLDWFEDVQVNLSAAERRAASLPARRSVKKNYQAAWLVKALQCIDLTTLAGDDTSGRVQRLCAKARRPLPETLLVGLYLLAAVGLCLSYFPYHRFVLVLSLLLLVVIALNNQFFLFLAARRGRAFAVAAIPFQLLYFFYCGVAYAIGWFRYRFRRVLGLADGVSPAAAATDSEG